MKLHLSKFIGALCFILVAFVVYGFDIAQQVSANAQKNASTITELHRHIDQQIEAQSIVTDELRELRVDVIKIKIKVGAD